VRLRRPCPVLFLPLLRARLHLHRVSPLPVRIRACHQEFVHHNQERQERNLPLLGPLPEPLRQLHRNDLLHLVRQCRPEAIAAQFPARNIARNVRVVRAPDSQCVLNLDKVAARLRRVPVVVPEAQVGLADKAVPGRKDPEEFHRALDRARVRPAVRRCCRHYQTKCRPKRSRVSRFTPAGQRNASGRWSTSARLKASASCIRRASVLVPVVAVRPQ